MCMILKLYFKVKKVRNVDFIIYQQWKTINSSLLHYTFDQLLMLFIVKR